VNDVIERIDRNSFAFEILRRFYRRGLQNLDGVAFILGLHVGRAAGDKLEIKSLDVSLIKGNDVGPTKLEIAGSHAIDDGSAAGQWQSFELQTLGFEKSLFHRHEHRRVVDDLHVT